MSCLAWVMRARWTGGKQAVPPPPPPLAAHLRLSLPVSRASASRSSILSHGPWEASETPHDESTEEFRL